MFSWVHVCLGQQNGAFIGRYFQQRKSVFPQQFHIVPIVNDAVRDGVLQLIKTALIGIQLLSDIGLQLIGSVWDHHLVFRTTDATLIGLYIEGKT